MHVSRYSMLLLAVASWFQMPIPLSAAAGKGAAAEPVVRDGLSVAIAAAKRVFAVRERLAFTITYKNVGGKDIWLFNPALGFSDGASFARLGTFTVASLASGERWRLVCQAEITRASNTGHGAVRIEAGQTYETAFTTAHLALAASPRALLLPIMPKPGKYRLQAELVFARPEAGEPGREYWTGTIKLNPVEFEVAAQAEEPDLLITEEANGRTVEATVGQLIEVRLEGDRPRTGWEASAPEGEAVQTLGARPGERGRPPQAVFTPKPGAQDEAIGTYAFHYRAVKPGQSRLRVVYVFPGGPEPTIRSATELVKEFVVTVNVTAPLAAKEKPGE